MTTEQGYKRILVATDFSPSADAALQQAVWLARKVGARITRHAHSSYFNWSLRIATTD